MELGGQLVNVEQWLEAQQRQHNHATFRVPFVAPKKVRMPHYKPTARHMEIAVRVLTNQEKEAAA